MPHLSTDTEFARAARNLINAHGSRAAAVAQKRAAYLEECGETLMADTWRQIGDAVRAVESGRPPARRKHSARTASPVGVAAADELPAAQQVRRKLAAET